MTEGDRRQGSTGAEVGRYQTKLIWWLTEEFGRSSTGPSVAETVEAESADTPLIPPCFRDGIGRGLGWQVGVETCVEAANLGKVRSKRLQSVDRPNGGRVVQGGQICQRFERIIGPFVKEDGLLERRATVNDPVAGCLGLRVPIEEGFERTTDVLRVEVRKVIGGDNPACIVQQAKLEATGACIDDQNVHVPTMPDRNRTWHGERIESPTRRREG